jgi:hypothetical protein
MGVLGAKKETPDQRNVNVEISRLPIKIRLSSRVITFLILFLGLAFGGREVPELFSLADDVSNDGERVEIVCPEEPGSSILSQRNEVGAPPYIDVPTNVHHFTSCDPSQVLHLQAGNDLLQLLSIQRE